MSQFFTDFLLVFALILVGGVFAMAEIALISLRDSQLDELKEQSKRGLKVAEIASDPNRFLSASQIGVTFVGFLSASYGAETLKPYLLPYVLDAQVSEPVANTIVLLGLIIIISYLSLVFGELVPKRLAMQRSTKIALLLASPLDKFAIVMRPVIWLLSLSTNAVFRLLGGDSNEKSGEVSKRELLATIETNKELHSDEREILSDVIELANRTLAEVMRPRGDVVFLNADLELHQGAKAVQQLPYSRFPVIGDGFDDVLGFVHVRDLLDLSAHQDAKTVRDVMRTILKFPSTNQLLPTLGLMRDRGVHIAIVQDEYGGTDGICTLEDIIEEIIGDIHDEYDLPVNPEIRTAKDGSFSVDAGISLSDFTEETSLQLEDGPYETVAGYILAKLGRVAQVGDSVEVIQCITAPDSEAQQLHSSLTWTLTVSRVDGLRIGRVKVKSLPSPNRLSELTT